MYVANNIFPHEYLNSSWRLVYGTFLQISTHNLFWANRKKLTGQKILFIGILLGVYIRAPPLSEVHNADRTELLSGFYFEGQQGDVDESTIVNVEDLGISIAHGHSQKIIIGESESRHSGDRGRINICNRSRNKDFSRQCP